MSLGFLHVILSGCMDRHFRALLISETVQTDTRRLFSWKISVNLLLQYALFKLMPTAPNRFVLLTR